MKPLLPLVLALATFALPAVARADTSADPTQSSGDKLFGVVSAVNGKYSLTVRNDRGGFQSVTLHQGTVINPTGLRLEPQTIVVIRGHENGGSFDADEIDAPVEAAKRPIQSTDDGNVTVPPVYVPTGTFQIQGGPNGTGGG